MDDSGAERCGRLRVAALTALMLWLPLTAAAVPSVYHSPDDDGSESTPLLPSIPLGTHAVHLYANPGAIPSAGGTACEVGTGDELCGWTIQLATRGQIAIQSFTPAPGQDIVWDLAPDAWRGTGGHVETGDLGATKLGDLVVVVSGQGFVELTSGAAVDAALGMEPIPGATIALPEPGGSCLLLCGAALLAVLGRRRERST